MSALFLHCRPGFENECAAEIQAKSASVGITGFCKAREHTGYVVFHSHDAGQASRLPRLLHFDELVFARQWFVVVELCKDLPVGDRVAPIVAALRRLDGPVAEFFLETPDTDAFKELSVFLRRFSKPLGDQLRRARLLLPDVQSNLRLHVCFLGSRSAYVGYSQNTNAAPWPMGVPRLRLSASAPSRSALKLEEALVRFLGREKRFELLRPGMTAVDLGAAPGGWTWVLMRHQLRVEAIDNGPLDQSLLETGLVEHRRVDGFSFRPAQPVDWMVSDMVDRPGRVARLVAEWVGDRLCRHSIFNLKLPMKKRYTEVERCLSLIRDHLEARGIVYELRCKHLYHDRQEVTGFLSAD